MKKNKFEETYLKKIIGQSYVDIDTSTYMTKKDITCPKCHSVHINEDEEKRSDFPDEDNDKIKIYYTCGDCNCHFICTLQEIITNIQIEEQEN